MATVQQWRAQMLGNLSSFDFGAFLAHPTSDSMYTQDPHKPSKFFWSSNVFQPSTALTGQQNLALLLGEQADKMAVRYDDVMSYESIIPTTNHENFHNVRKSSRAILYLTKMFSCITVSSSATNISLDLLHNVYEKFGDLNDDWTAYDYYVQHKNNTAAAAEKKVVDDGWTALKAWASQQNVRTNGMLVLKSQIANSPATQMLP
jgi:hypothetical protein